MSPSVKNPLFGSSLARPMPGVPSLACPAAPPLSPCTTAPMAQDRSKAVPIQARIYSQIRFPKHQVSCCWGTFSTLLPNWLLKMKQRYGWLQLIPCYHTSGLMWICNEAREAAWSDMNQAKLLGMVSPVSGPSTRGTVEFLKSSQKQCKKRGGKDYLPISK